jgi:hypothetical protein
LTRLLLISSIEEAGALHLEGLKMVLFISPRTSSTDFHFDDESAADWPETAGSMTVFHS